MGIVLCIFIFRRQISIYFFFFLPFPFHLTGLSVTFYGRLGFFFLCGAAGLRGTFPGYLRPPSLLSFFWTTQLLSLIFIKNYLLQLFIIKIVTPAARTPMNTVWFNLTKNTKIFASYRSLLDGRDCTVK
jgi:hypothetical protein